MLSRRTSRFRFWPLLAVALGSACNDRLIAPIDRGALLLAAPDTRPGPAADRRESSGPTFDLSTDSSALAGSAASLSATAAAGGSPFVVWQNTQTGERAFWEMLGTAYTGKYISLGRTPTPWEIVGTADLSCDGSADIVWQNNQTGERGFWRMTGTAYTGGWGAIGFVSPVWRIAGVADFTGDGKPDIVWENTANGQRGIWPMNCGTYTGQWIALGNVGLTWRIAAAADFTADGQPDLAWFNPQTRETVIWKMNGSVYSGTQNSVGFIPAGWDLVAAGDYTCDGNNDLIWQNTQTGERQVWQMNGTTFAVAFWIGNVGTAWDIAATLSTTAACGPAFQFDPNPNYTNRVTDTLNVSVRSLQAVQLTNVTATIANYPTRTTNLTFNRSDGWWSGKIPVVGLPAGTHHVTLFVTDAGGAKGGATGTFTNVGGPPVLAVSPGDSAVARPTIHLLATCTDPNAGNCQSIEARVDGNVIASGTNRIDTDVSLAHYEGRMKKIVFSAVSSTGRTDSTSRGYYVESNTRLVPVFTVPDGGRFHDIRGDSILYSAFPANSHGELRLHRIASNTDVVLFNTGAAKGYLYSAGAVFSQYNTTCTNSNYCHAQVSAAGAINFGAGLNWVGSGDFVYWNQYEDQSQGFRRDLIRRSTTSVPAKSYGAVTGGPNGDIVWVAYPTSGVTPNELKRLRGGVVTTVGTPRTLWSWGSPITDGINVVAQVMSPFPNPPSALYLIDANGVETLLSTDLSSPYFAANGFVAFQKADQFGFTQAFVRSPAGTISQASYFAASVKLDALGIDGAVMYVASNGSRYLNKTNVVSPPIIGSTLGKAFFRGSTPYVVVGRTVFKVVAP